jgi:hypothetical protein
VLLGTEQVVVLVKSRTDAAVVRSRTGAVVVNFRTGSAVVNFRTGVAVVGFRTGPVVVNLRTGVAAVNSRTGMVVNSRTGMVVNSRTGVVVNSRIGVFANSRTGAVVNSRTDVVHHGEAEGMKVLGDQEDWNRKEHIQAQKALKSIHSPLAHVALRDPQREAHHNGVPEGLMAERIQGRYTRSLHSRQLVHHRKLRSGQFRNGDGTLYNRGYPQRRENTHVCACRACPSCPSCPSYPYPYPYPYPSYPYPYPSSPCPCPCPCPCPSSPSGVFRSRPHRDSAAGITDLPSLRLRALESWK